MRHRAPLAAAAATAAAAALLAMPGAAAADPPRTTDENALRQASLVQSEDDRLMKVRAVAAVANLQGGPSWSRPYRLDTGSGYTLVLTQRSAPYGVADLLRLAPQTFTRLSDGSYLLTENIFVSAGAKLKLANPGGLTVRLVSSGNGFVSIVSFGGQLTLDGTPQARTIITSWDPRVNKPDVDVNDGRAYVRAIGGQFTMRYTTVEHLGFWSGRTGGLSLTGTERPDTGVVDGPEQLTATERRQGSPQRQTGPATSKQPPSAGGVNVLPSGALTSPDTRFTLPGQSYVSVEISHATLRGNAFGLFISSAQGINITDTTVERSLEDGLVMHRGAFSAVIERTTSRGNGGDGFVLSRATQQVRVSGATADGNGGNGFTISGQPLANGPSASGQSTASYGFNSVANSVAVGNGHYGIEVLGGIDVGLQNNRVEGGDMGIVIRQGGTNVAVTGNHLKDQQRQGIAVRDGVTGVAVTGNIVDGAETGIYVRDSVAEVRGNTITAARNHGVTFVGEVGGSAVSYNVIAGVGPSALDLTRSRGRTENRANQTFAWHDTRAFWIKMRHYATPMTLLWVGIFLLMLLPVVRRNRALMPGLKPRPYAQTRPLALTPPQELVPARSAVRVPELVK